MFAAAPTNMLTPIPVIAQRHCPVHNQSSRPTTNTAAAPHTSGWIGTGGFGGVVMAGCSTTAGAR